MELKANLVLAFNIFVKHAHGVLISVIRGTPFLWNWIVFSNRRGKGI